MLSALWLLVPDSMLVLVIMGIGVAIIVGMSPRKGLALLASLIMWLIFAPFIETIFALIPLWLTLVVIFVVGMQLLRGVLEFVFGKEAAGHIIGGITLAAFLFIFRAMFLPIRLAARGMGHLLTRRTF